MLRAVLDAVQEAVYVKDLQGRYVMVNAAAGRMLGRPIIDILGRDDSAFFPRQEAERLRANDLRVVESGIMETWEEELEVGGVLRYLVTTKLPYRDTNRRTAGLIGISRDITDRRHAERAQRESEERFRMLADTAPVLIWVAGTDMLCEFFNRAWLQYRGRTLEEELGNGWTEGVHPDDFDRCMRTRLAAFETREAFRTEYRLQRQDGEYRWVIDTGVPRYLPGGEFAGYVGSCLDVHERTLEQQALEENAGQLEALTAELEMTVDQLHARTAEAEAARAAAESEEERSRLLDEASSLLLSSLDYETTLRAVAQMMVPRFGDWCGVHIVDDDGQVRQLEVAHVDPDRLRLALQLQERYPERPEMDQGVYGVVRTGKTQIYPEITEEGLRAGAQDEEHFRLLLSMNLRSAILVPMKVVGRTVGVISLISSSRRYTMEDQRLLEELGRRAALAVEHARLYNESQQANRAKSDFLATMSHELRTPLNAITGYADLLQLAATDESQRQAHLDRIKASAWHLLSIIEEILSFSRMEAGRETVNPETVDAAELGQEAAAMVAPVALQKGIDFKVELGSEPLQIQTDRSKLRQILLNLLSNAIKFTERGSVTLEGHVEGDEIRIQVSDTGIGIDPENIERIFEPFWQVDRGMRRRTGGTGLGLTVSRQLAQLLGGDLTVESEPGKGSVFTVRLPVRYGDSQRSTANS
jgi:PAS domain S-box-containing protein